MNDKEIFDFIYKDMKAIFVNGIPTPEESFNNSMDYLESRGLKVKNYYMAEKNGIIVDTVSSIPMEKIYFTVTVK